MSVDALVERYDNLVKTGAAYAAGELRGAPTSIFEIYIGHFREIGKKIADALESERSRADRLEKALKPFAKIAEAEDHAGTKPGESVLVNVDRCRDARTALGKEDVR